MEFTVYILFSESTSTFYIGSTQNLENRIVEHNQGETKSIKHGIPWEVIWQTQLRTRAVVMQLETKIKKRGAKRFLEDLSRGAFGAKVVSSPESFRGGHPDLNFNAICGYIPFSPSI
jgi:putative endonuclease